MEGFRIKTLEDECLRFLDESGAMLDTDETGEHYLLHSGLHTKTFFQLSRAFEYGPARERFAHLLIVRMREKGIDPKNIDILAGPAFGALPIIYTLQHFSDFEHTRAIFVERDMNGKLVLGRGFSLTPDERIFIVDDVVTTFGTIRETIKALNTTKKAGKDGWDAYILGFAALIDRTSSDFRSEIHTPTLTSVMALRKPLDSCSAKDCQYCQRGIPLVRP